MSSGSEAAFETHITEWLASHGGYRVKVGNLGAMQADFDPEVGVDVGGFV